MAMVLTQSRLRVTQAIYFGKPPGGGGGTVTAVGGGNGITATPGPIVGVGNLDLGPLTSDWDGGNFNANTRNSTRIFNVRAYGAVGDSVTDDIVAIQAAVTAAQAVHGVVYFPRSSGFYRVSSSIVVQDANGISLIGEGPVASQIAATAGSPAITVLDVFSNVSSGTIHDVIIKDLGITAGATGIALRIWNCLQFNVQNVYTAGGATSLSIQGSGSGVLNNVQAWSGASVGNGAGAVTNSGPLSFTGAHFVRNASATPSLVISGDVLGITFASSGFHNAGGTQTCAVQIDGGASTVGSVDFYDCHSESNYNNTNTAVDFLIGSVTKSGHVGFHGGSFWGHGNSVNYQASWLKIVAATDVVVEGVIVSKLGDPNGYNTAMIRIENTFPAAGDTYRFASNNKDDIAGVLYSDAGGFLTNITGSAQNTSGALTGNTALGVPASGLVAPSWAATLQSQGFVGWNYHPSQAASRNWAFRSDNTAFGDFNLLTSSVQTVGLLDVLRMQISPTGNFGLNVVPTRTLDFAGTQRYRGIAAPAVSEANSGTIYFDSASNKLKASLNGSAYVDVIGSGGVTGSGTTGQVAYFDGVTSLASPSGIYIDAINNRLGINAPVPGYPLELDGEINFVNGPGQVLVSGTPVAVLGALDGSTALGGLAGVLTTGDTAIGSGALANSTGAGTGSNTAVGMQAGVQITTGANNIAVGTVALSSTTTGSDNVAVGTVAGGTNSIGTDNVFVGNGADATVGNLTNAIAIGSGAVVGASDSMVLGDAAMKVGIRTGTPVQPLDVDGAVAFRHKNIAVANGLNSDIALTDASLIRLTGPVGAFSIGGFTGGTDGRVLRIINTTAQAMTIVNLDAGSAATNQITTLTGADVVLAARTSAATLVYEDASDTWILFSYN